VTAVYIAEANGTPKAGDDAKNSGIFTFDNLTSELAFDHALVLADYQYYLTTGQVTPLRF